MKLCNFNKQLNFWRKINYHKQHYQTYQLGWRLKTFLSMREVWGSIPGQGKLNTVSPTACLRCDVFSKPRCLSAKMDPPLVTSFGVIPRVKRRFYVFLIWSSNLTNASFASFDSDRVCPYSRYVRPNEVFALCSSTSSPADRSRCFEWYSIASLNLCIAT